MSTIKVDTLVAADGSSPATLTKQDAAKMYSTHGTDAVIDKSLNTSSVTDEGTGSFTSAYTNNMASAVQAYATTCWGTSNQSFTNIRTHSTSSHRVNCYTHGGGADDRSCTSSVNGDLA